MLPKRAPLTRAALPRPVGPLDPRLEEAASRALETRRGKAASKGGPPQAGALATRIIRPLLKGGKSGKSLDEIKRQWRDIVGDKLAVMTEPEKLTQSAASGRVLTIKVAGPAAPFVQHQTPLLLERCNLAGADLTRLTIKQGVIARPVAGNVRPLSSPLAADEERLLLASLTDIGNPRLKAALLKLGRQVGQRR
jgi:hypothetical protein